MIVHVQITSQNVSPLHNWLHCIINAVFYAFLLDCWFFSCLYASMSTLTSARWKRLLFVCLLYCIYKIDVSINIKPPGHDLVIPVLSHRSEMLQRGGGCGKHRLWALSHTAVCYHGQCQCKSFMCMFLCDTALCLYLYLRLCLCLYLWVSVILYLCVCAVDCRGDGDHAVGCGVSGDPMWVASRGLAGGSGLHGEFTNQSELSCSRLLAVCDKIREEYNSWRRAVIGKWSTVASGGAAWCDEEPQLPGHSWLLSYSRPSWCGLFIIMQQFAFFYGDSLTNFFLSFLNEWMNEFFDKLLWEGSVYLLMYNLCFPENGK